MTQVRDEENATRPNQGTTRPNTAVQITTGCYQANHSAAAWNFSSLTNGDTGRSKMQPVTNDNEVSADSAFAAAHLRRSLCAPFLDAGKLRDLHPKTTNAMKDAPHQVPRLNFKPADQESVGLQATLAQFTELCAGKALCGSQKKKV